MQHLSHQPLPRALLSLLPVVTNLSAPHPVPLTPHILKNQSVSVVLMSANKVYP